MVGSGLVVGFVSGGVWLGLAGSAQFVTNSHSPVVYMSVCVVLTKVLLCTLCVLACINASAGLMLQQLDLASFRVLCVGGWRAGLGGGG